MMHSSKLVYWTDLGEKLRIYYSFLYEDDFPNIKARIFCHKVINERDEIRKGEMIILVDRDRWARLHGINSVEAAEQFQQIVKDRNSGGKKFLLDIAEKNLEDFVDECKRSSQFVIKPIIV